MAAAGQVLFNLVYASHVKHCAFEFIKHKSSAFNAAKSNTLVPFHTLAQLSSAHSLIAVTQASASSSDTIPSGEEGISLGTLKLPANTDLDRFETLLFQWGNSLCQGANLPLPAPLKVDKIPGGARLGFITIEDGKTEVLAYIDCLVFPATEGSGPMFRATRKGPKKDQVPPGEPRIMRSLLAALKKCVELTRL